MKNTPAEIEQGMINKNVELQRSIEEVPELINNMGKAEKDYEVAFAQKTLELKTKGTPITIIPKIVAGDKAVSDLKFQYHLCKELVKIQYAKIDAIKTAINSYQSMHALRRIEYQKANIQD